MSHFSMASIKIFLREEAPRKNGSIGVYLRVRVERKKKDYSLGVSILEPKKYWDSANNRMKTCSWQDVDKINRNISAGEKKANDIIFDYQWGDKKDKPFSIKEFDNEFRKNQPISKSFYAFAENEIEILKHKNASSETIRSYNSYISKLKRFAQELSFTDITRDFISRYHANMVSNGNQVNTVHKSLSFVRTMLKRAQREGIIQENPFIYYPLQKKAGNRQFLNIDELNRIEKLYASGTMKGYQSNACKSFLFSCYTGLRYQDVRNLRFENVKKEVHEGKDMLFIRITMHKTKDPVSIPLIDKAVRMIGEGFPAQKVFRVPSNQVINRYLKEISELAGIDKKVSFHVSRHTFATISIIFEIPLEVVSKLLGHNSLKTTMIYTKIPDSVKINYMDRWNEPANQKVIGKTKAKAVKK
ncbi:MAG: site-specific integrase [Bacteroidetes bacterium]|nr:site-specific integrase [Bacteroidota bacterium]